MKWFKYSIAVIVATFILCTIIVIFGGTMMNWLMKKMDSVPSSAVSRAITVQKEGKLPQNINCLYSEGTVMYFTGIGRDRAVKSYDVEKRIESTVISPQGKDNSINAFNRFGDSMVWEEDNYPTDDDSENEGEGRWAIYGKSAGNVFKIDEGSGTSDWMFPGKISRDGNIIVYKSCDMDSGSESTGASIKVYDLDKHQGKTVFSSLYDGGVGISDPDINGGYIVWSAYGVKNVEKGAPEAEGGIYAYNIKSGTYRVISDDKGIQPLIWNNFIIYGRGEGGGRSIVVMNLSSGYKKEIAKGDTSLSPQKEVLDWTCEEGNVVWNNSYCDRIEVYNLSNGQTYQLKSINPDDEDDNKLLNIKILGKMIVYIDHVFNKDDGDTVSETVRYILLK